MGWSRTNFPRSNVNSPHYINLQMFPLTLHIIRDLNPFYTSHHFEYLQLSKFSAHLICESWMSLPEVILTLNEKTRHCVSS